MGSLKKSCYTIPLPEGAKISKSGIVTWIAKGTQKTGKLTKNKEAVNRILIKLENDVLSVRAGALTRNLCV